MFCRRVWSNQLQNRRDAWLILGCFINMEFLKLGIMLCLSENFQTGISVILIALSYILAGFLRY